MKLIKELEEMIEDEVHDIKHYAKKAIELKGEHPALAQVLYTISTQEDSHQAMIHAEVVKLIEEYRRLHGNPPEAMMAIYEYIHERHIEKLEEARRYQEIYKKS
jgi:hypothetical protein